MIQNVVTDFIKRIISVKYVYHFVLEQETVGRICMPVNTGWANTSTASSIGSCDTPSEYEQSKQNA